MKYFNPFHDFAYENYDTVINTNFSVCLHV